MQRAQYTLTGQSIREKELLSNMGHLEDQLEAYRRLGPSLSRHLEMQAATAKSLKALEAKAVRIEDMAATLWWDSKMVLCVVIIFGSALCGYVSFLHARQNSRSSSTSQWPPDVTKAQKFDVAEPKDEALDEMADCEYFNLDAERDADGLTAEDRWWIQPCGPRASFVGGAEGLPKAVLAARATAQEGQQL